MFFTTIWSWGNCAILNPEPVSFWLLSAPTCTSRGKCINSFPTDANYWLDNTGTSQHYLNWNLQLIQYLTIIWEKTQAGSLGRFLLRGFWADLNKIGHGQSVGVREQPRDVGILKSKTVAMEIWKCGLWGSIWPWSTGIFQPGSLKI